jgi:hypothetical protein
VSTHLEATVPVPVITQPGADLALARGAALASAQSTEFTDAEMLKTVNIRRQDHEASGQRSYAGALTMLGAGAVTFVASLSLAMGQHLVPHHASDPVRPMAHWAAAPVAEAPAPRPAAVETPAARPASKPAPEQAPAVQQQPVVAQAPVNVPAAAPVQPPVAPPPPPEEPPNPHPLLTKLLERLHGQAPDQQPPPLPPPPGAPSP